MKERKGTNKKYSPEFKISVILDMRENRLSYCETVRKYGLGSAETGGARDMLQRWERKYLEEGIEGLTKDNRGRPTVNGKKRGRPPKLDKQVEEDLIAENQRLRMENEYLKKLNALVQERIERERNQVAAIHRRWSVGKGDDDTRIRGYHSEQRLYQRSVHPPLPRFGQHRDTCKGHRKCEKLILPLQCSARKCRNEGYKFGLECSGTDGHLVRHQLQRSCA